MECLFSKLTYIKCFSLAIAKQVIPVVIKKELTNEAIKKIEFSTTKKSINRKYVHKLCAIFLL